jgi:hypothetical protein
MRAQIWLKAVLVGGLILSIAVAAVAWRGQPFGWMFWLIWPAMALHQCEEHVLTELVLGPRAAFLAWLRTVGYDLSPLRALQLNVLVGWTMAILAGLAGSRYPLVPLFVILVEAVNGFWHLSITAQTRRWSPGTLSSVVITIPLAFFLAYSAVASQQASPAALFATFVLAAASHHVFLSTLPRTR